jgi:T4 RnlA family RNA ligase
MKNYSITYNDAVLIAKKYKNFNFYERLYRVENYKVSSFKYFLCNYDDFAYPLGKDNIANAFNMRGLTFVFNEDGSLFKKYLMLPKFFNINQVESTQYDVLKDKTIKHISYKEDGSLIAFMLLPNGHLFAKTNGDILNEQSEKALNIVSSNEEYKSFVLYCLNNDLTPLFEYVAFDNRIVLLYNKPELIFIGARNNTTGVYLNADEFKTICYIPFKKITSLPLEELSYFIKEAETRENIEGWVIEFTDGQLVKQKTKWYCNLHGLRTESIFREDYIIEHFLNETLDDIIAQLDSEYDKDALEFINKVIISVKNYSEYIDNEVNNLVSKFNGDWKEYAINNSKHYLFSLSKVKINDSEYYNKTKVNYILKRIYKLSEAKLVVEKYKNYKL